ncbi:MAG: Holliday junction branch migration protein RuvA [Bacilli bacterium]
MFSYIIGKVVDVKKDSIDLLINSICFEVVVTHLDQYYINDEKKVFIYDVMKEEVLTLYGFKDIDELLLFKKIISVSGVGYKTAFSLLNNLSTSEIINYIITKNILILSKIPGVSSKAEKIVVGLQNKFKTKDYPLFEYENVFLALKKIGYDSKVITIALNKIPKNLCDEEAISMTIKEIANNGK